MTKNYEFKTHSKFDKEFDKLTKKCPSLKDDFKKLKRLILFDLENGDHYLPNDRYHQIQRLDVKFPVFKIKKFRCKSIPKGNRSGFRFIFILNRKTNVIFFSECYFKGKKEMENKERIKEICSNYEKYLI